MKPESPCTDNEARLKIVQELGSVLSWDLDVSENRLAFDGAGPYLLAGPEEFDLDELLDSHVPAETAEAVHLLIREIIRSGRVDDRELVLALNDGSIRYLRINGRSVVSEDGPVTLAGALQDVTDWRLEEQEAEERVRFIDTLFNTIADPVYFKDTDLIYRHCNSAFAEIIGLPRDRIIGHSAGDFIAADHAQTIREQDLEVLASQGSATFQTALRYGNRTHDLLFSKSAVFDSEGHLTGIVGTFFDLTEQVAAQALELRMTKLKDIVMAVNAAILEKSALSELYEYIIEEALSIMDHADCGAILTLGDGDVMQIAAARGYAAELTKDFHLPLRDTFQWKMTDGRIDDVLIINDLDVAFDPAISETLLAESSGSPVRSSISSPIFVGGKLFGFINIDSSRNQVFTEEDRYLMDYLRRQIANSIEKFKLYENMLFLSSHDSQTGLYNRRFFMETLGHVIEKGLRYDERFLIASFDIDGLKQINDTLGHLAGDALIQKFAAALRIRCRSTDVLARMGGDEFVALIHRADASDMQQKFDSMKHYFAINPFQHEGRKFTCRFGFGIASFPEDGTTCDMLLNKADQRMYADKRKPRSSP